MQSLQALQSRSNDRRSDHCNLNRHNIIHMCDIHLNSNESNESNQTIQTKHNKYNQKVNNINFTAHAPRPPHSIKHYVHANESKNSKETNRFQ